VGGGRKLRFLGLARNRCWLEFTAAAYNLVRMAKLEVAAQPPCVRDRAAEPQQRNVTTAMGGCRPLPSVLYHLPALLQQPARGIPLRREWPAAARGPLRPARGG